MNRYTVIVDGEKYSVEAEDEQDAKEKGITEHKQDLLRIFTKMLDRRYSAEVKK